MAVGMRPETKERPGGLTYVPALARPFPRGVPGERTTGGAVGTYGRRPCVHAARPLLSRSCPPPPGGGGGGNGRVHLLVPAGSHSVGP